MGEELILLLKKLSVTLFNRNLSNSTPFSKIHLDRQYTFNAILYSVTTRQELWPCTLHSVALHRQCNNNFRLVNEKELFASHPGLEKGLSTILLLSQGNQGENMCCPFHIFIILFTPK